MTKVDQKIVNTCLVIITTIMLAFALYFSRTVLIPFAFAIFLYAAISIFEDYALLKWKVSKVVFMFTFFTAFLIFIVGIHLLFAEGISDFLKGSAVYRQKLFEVISVFSPLAEQFGLELDQDAIQENLSILPIFSYAGDVTGRLFSFLGQSSLTFIFLLFLLGKKNRSENPIVVKVRRKMTRYLATKTAVSFLTGLIVGILLLIFNVDLLLVISLLTVGLNFIPSLGSIFATLIPLPVLLLQFGFSATSIGIFVGIGLLQFVVGNIIEPKLMGETLDLHPITVLFFLLFWGLVWGIPGLFLAVPITASLSEVLSVYEGTRPISEILSGRAPSHYW